MEEAVRPISTLPQKEEALSWIRECLSSDKTLPRRALQRLDLAQATVVAVLPAEAPLVDIRAGFGSRDASTRLLYEHLASAQQPNDVFVVVDELLTRKDHADWQDFGTPILTFGDEIYHWSTLSDLKSPEELEKFLNWSSTGHPLNGFIVGAQTASSWGSEQPLDEVQLEELVEATREVIVGAFDADGFLLVQLAGA